MDASRANHEKINLHVYKVCFYKDNLKALFNLNGPLNDYLACFNVDLYRKGNFLTD